MVTLNEYQTRAMTTAIYTSIGHPCVYPALGLAEESGEVLGNVKRIFRDDAGVVTPERARLLLAELGDVLWYVACLAHELHYSLEDVALYNLDKTASRKARGVIQGSGDVR